MLSDPFTIDFNNDPTLPLEFNRINTGDYSGVYSRIGDNNDRTMTIKHTVPKKAGDVESHLIRLDDKYYVDGEYIRTQSVWLSFKTEGGPQNAEALKQHIRSLCSFLLSGKLDEVIGRES